MLLSAGKRRRDVKQRGEFQKQTNPMETGFCDFTESCLQALPTNISIRIREKDDFTQPHEDHDCTAAL